MRLASLMAAAFALVGAIAAAQDYIIRAGDTLEVSVLEDPALNRSALVRPDGRISLPLAGTIEASGRTIEDVQNQIRRALANDFITPPTVTVSLLDVGDPSALDAGLAGSIYMIGAVNNPGRYDVALPIDVLQALALAGGPGVFAAADRIQVRRRDNAGEIVMLFDYEAIADGLTPSAKIALADGDVIVVPERGLFD